MSNFENEDWFGLYQSAVLELERVKMSGRIADARAGITKRLEALRNLPGLHEQEQNSLSDALRILRSLEQEEARLAAEDVKSVAAQVLKGIEPIAIKITPVLKNGPVREDKLEN